MLRLRHTFDLRTDVESDIHRKEASVKEYSGAVDTRILNIEKGGVILYSWEGANGTTRIGKYDPCNKQNKLLYKFYKQVCVSSCSLNKEESLLAVSLVQNTRGNERLKPMSKCLTLLIEIHPGSNNTKVLKAVDCRVKVQFLYQETYSRSVLESHLLLLTEDGYVDLYHVLLTKQEGYRVVMANPERLSKTAERIVEDLCWVQWDGHTQRLYYLTKKNHFLLRSVQFFPNHSCTTVMELQLDLPPSSFQTIQFINLGFDHYHTETPEQEPVRIQVFTNRTGSMCVCYSQCLQDSQELLYTVVLVHKDCSKKFRVSLGGDESMPSDAPPPPPPPPLLHPLFIPIGHYILVYVQGLFLHCINSRQHEMLCHSLFLSGDEVNLGLEARSADITVLQAEEESAVCLLDVTSGRIYNAELSTAHLLQILQSKSRMGSPSSTTDPQRLAALHCLLVYMGNDPNLELEIIEWLCDNVNPFESFDPIQEFILASLYRICYSMSLGLDKLLPYSSVFEKKDVPPSLLEIPGVSCTTELNVGPVFMGKARLLQGFWSELQWNTEQTKYLDSLPKPRYITSHIKADWDKYRSETRPCSNMKHVEENTKKVFLVVDTWCSDKKLVPLFHEDDHQQRALIGLTVDKLREHLIRHLPRLGKKKIDSLVVNYVAKLLELVRHMLESVWLKHELGPCVLCLKQKASPAEWSMFHFMFRILESTQGLCLPLPPGYHTLCAVFAVRCLPHHTFLQYIDHRFLQLTETFVSRLMTDLDNSDDNERLKFSVLKRITQKNIYHMWDHPVSSASISRDYVRTLLEKRNKTKGLDFTDRDMPGFRSEFLPLTYVAKILSDVEEQALNPFKEQENVDARFVEETALKQTLILLGFDKK
ncbi:gamma-secretase-activating protein isoform X2 [Gouania willdenowi]|uniref:gamma-secretase-activating protein isoform X2 n=1 Tax=Gouania willdenowi TaxID=441366 RepID=UPI0010552023|nr:gamma-secretase-activating protein isoform X2 [Gouania willdenowi]